jgi:hypothetical protein
VFGPRRHILAPDCEAILCLCCYTRSTPLTVFLTAVIVERSAGKDHSSYDVPNLSQTTPLPKHSKGCHLAPASESGWPRTFDWCHGRHPHH